MRQARPAACRAAVSTDVAIRAADFIRRSIERSSGVRYAGGGSCGGHVAVAAAMASRGLPRDGPHKLCASLCLFAHVRVSS